VVGSLEEVLGGVREERHEFLVFLLDLLNSLLLVHLHVVLVLLNSGWEPDVVEHLRHFILHDHPFGQLDSDRVAVDAKRRVLVSFDGRSAKHLEVLLVFRRGVLEFF